MIEQLWDWLFPVGCPGCGSLDSRGFCPPCRAPLGSLVLPLEGRPILTCAAYRGSVRRAVLALKQQGYYALAKPLGEVMAVSVRQTWEDALVVVPVPSAPSRSRFRGVNPAGLLARQLSARLGYEYRPDWLRIVGDPAPRKSLSRADRLLDQEAQFVAASAAKRPVLLVDDVVTSGQTLLRCARALERAGCPEVRAIALARAA